MRCDALQCLRRWRRWLLLLLLLVAFALLLGAGPLGCGRGLRTARRLPPLARLRPTCKPSSRLSLPQAGTALNRHAAASSLVQVQIVRHLATDQGQPAAQPQPEQLS
jgi:hypothetical protein